ncbi:MAG: hypothetical protein PHH54_03425 [Candidatus Nanoarchaeia archaeon]|nr:hypothetical protein [Candidatus Nanoarchaeia archaeon]MDD5741008.1 hypothetical protein [Candidatus Nanoarchaeia archaeon]
MTEKIITINEAVSRSLPAAIESKHLKEYINKSPRKYSVCFSEAKPAFGTNPAMLKKGSAVLRVDMDEWLDIYPKLLENPSLIKGYVELLPKGVKKIVESGDYFTAFSRGYKNDKKVLITEDARNRAWVCILFGINDHADLCWEIDKGKTPSFKNYFEQEIVKLFKPIKYKSVDKMVTAYDLKGLNYAQNNDRLYLHPFSFEDRIIPFASFFMPVCTVEHKKVFDGIKGLVDIIKGYEGITEISIVPGDCSCFLPTWKRRK